MSEQGAGPTGEGEVLPAVPETTPPVERSDAAPGQDPLRGSPISGVWWAVAALGVLLVFLVIFVAQNTQSVSVQFLGWSGSAPLSVTLLVAAAAGLLIATTAGALRILELRRRVRRDERATD